MIDRSRSRRYRIDHLSIVVTRVAAKVQCGAGVSGDCFRRVRHAPVIHNDDVARRVGGTVRDRIG